MRFWMSLKMKVQAGIHTTCGSSQAEGGTRGSEHSLRGPLATTSGHQVVRVAAGQNHFLMMLSIIERASLM